MGTNAVDQRDGGEMRAFYIRLFWRDHLMDNYGMERDNFYSPTNPAWNADRFWTMGNHAVISYSYFGNRPGLEDPAYSGLSSRFADARRPVFPRRVTDDPYAPFLVTDLNRQWPAGSGSFVTPGDPGRWGANHLYGGDGIGDHPTGSHGGRLDGSVTWVHGEDVKERFLLVDTLYFW